MTRKIKLHFLIAVLALVFASCGAATAADSPTTTITSITQATTTTAANASQAKHPHIFVIVMENLGYSAAMATPQLIQLAHRWAYATNYFATIHPSLPNYLSMIGGSTFGISSDCTGCFVNAPNLPTELSQNGIPWAAYMESIPNDCYLSPYAPDGMYAGKHDPFIYFDNIRSNLTLCSDIKPLSHLTSQFANSSANLPNFIWITPNLCNDGHNCSAAAAGVWLNKMVNQIVSLPAWKQNGALYVTWDEGNGGDHRGLTYDGSIASTGGGGHILTLVIEPGLSKGQVISQHRDHYSLLKTIEINFGVPQINQSANSNLSTLP